MPSIVSYGMYLHDVSGLKSVVLVWTPHSPATSVNHLSCIVFSCRILLLISFSTIIWYGGKRCQSEIMMKKPLLGQNSRKSNISNGVLHENATS